MDRESPVASWLNGISVEQFDPRCAGRVKDVAPDAGRNPIVDGALRRD
jgi:hypothetical protein